MSNREFVRRVKDITRQKSMIVTIILIVLLTITTFFVVYRLDDLEEEKCFDRLYEEAGQLRNEIEKNAKSDREQLEMLAAIIAKYEDFTSQDLWKILDSFSMSGMMSRIELLLPDDTVLTTGGQRIETNGELSFAKEAKQGVHITNRETEIGSEDEYIVRNYVPVIRGGETVAMLYGVVELGSLPEEMMMEPYSGQAAIYIVDGKTGEFLVDTWHNEPGNIWEMGERKMAPGYNHEQLKQGMIEGESRYVVFVSETIGEYLYFYYEPIAINDWRIALSVPESVVFASANTIKIVLRFFAVFEAVCFIAYFLWMVHYSRLESDEKQRQLDSIHFIYDVEKLLFNAHENQKNIDLALEKVGYILAAESVGFCFGIQGQADGKSSYYWQKDALEKEPLMDEEIMVELQNYFAQGHQQFEEYQKDRIQELLPNVKKDKLRNLVAVEVGEQEDGIQGILAGCNVTNRKTGAVFLKSISISFRMFCRNMQSYFMVKAQGEKDILSGLNNRNRYEMDLQKLREYSDTSIACIYIDVNGLHELNNSKGHEAGDHMLRQVAEQIREKFGTQFTYRIGGDEFLAFALGVPGEMVEQQVAAISENLQKKNIFVSFGIQWEEGEFVLDSMIKEAEKKMYQSKRLYYEKEENDRRRRI